MGCGLSIPDNRVAVQRPPTPELELPEDPSGLLKLNIKKEPKQLVEGDVLIFILGTPGTSVGILAERIADEFKLDLLSTSSLKTEIDAEVPTHLERDNRRFGTQSSLALNEDVKTELMEIYVKSFARTMLMRKDCNQSLRGFIISLKSDEYDLARAVEEKIRPCNFLLYLEASEEWLVKGKASMLLHPPEKRPGSDNDKHDKKDKNGEEEPEGEEIQMERKSLRRYKKFKENTSKLVDYYRSVGRFHMIKAEKMHPFVYEDIAAVFYEEGIAANPTLRPVQVVVIATDSEPELERRLVSEYRFSLLTYDQVIASGNVEEKPYMEISKLTSEGAQIPLKLQLKALARYLLLHPSIRGRYVTGFDFSRANKELPKDRKKRTRYLEYTIYSLEGLLEQNHVSAVRKLMRNQEAQDLARQREKKQRKKDKQPEIVEPAVDHEIQWAYQCYCTRDNDRYFFPYNSDPQLCVRVAEILDDYIAAYDVASNTGEDLDVSINSISSVMENATHDESILPPLTVRASISDDSKT